MSFKIPQQFLNATEDVVLNFDNQTFVQFHRKKECIKRPVVLDQHLIMIILKGAKVMISAEETSVVNQYETLILKRGLYITSEKILEDGQFSALLFFIHDDFLNQFTQKYQAYFSLTPTNNTPQQIFKIDASYNLAAYTQSLLPYFDEQQQIAIPILQLKIEELLLSLLFSNQRKQFGNFLLTIGNKGQQAFRASVEKCIFLNLTIKERAFLMNMSVSAFKRKFRAVFSETPAKWFRVQKLTKARFLLETTTKNIGEIAFETGFESPSHFTQLFKKQFGLSPKQLARKF
ncbi:helix-turn-helix transcriptional regulator [Aureispira anguillae]|uniref:Helix-turn-helix transcriptional regulator n=1 Tax=Aureispira anguillae TaxID=2864201 RepID=A0A915YKY3_9BACT|nr:helix-turn-helix transcriptional regulator [Aureispira anguillae]BDS15008.1 helix-turn-helix transcriptional regulator [Aureispira anguillae]